jgi:hypothetical protein
LCLLNSLTFFIDNNYLYKACLVVIKIMWFYAFVCKYFFLFFDFFNLFFILFFLNLFNFIVWACYNWFLHIIFVNENDLYVIVRYRHCKQCEWIFSINFMRSHFSFIKKNKNYHLKAWIIIFFLIYGFYTFYFNTKTICRGDIFFFNLRDLAIHANKCLVFRKRSFFKPPYYTVVCINFENV